MGNIYLVPPPRYRGRNETLITRHLLTHLEGRPSLIGFSSEHEKAPTWFVYDIDTWLKHQLRSVRNVMEIDFTSEDQIIFIDFWFPGLDIVKLYLEDRGVHPTLVGYLHGASFVPGDAFESSKWAPHIERGWMEMYDVVWAASNFFVEGIPENYWKKVHIVGEPFDPDDYIRHRRLEDKQFDVVFPHRLTADKGVDDLLDILFQLAAHSRPSPPTPTVLITAAYQPSDIILAQLQKYPNVAVHVGKDEAGHIEDLASAKIVLSTAYQEGWGYAVLKAITVGCVPVLPYRAVYPELYPTQYLYLSREQAVTMIQAYLKLYPDNTFIPPRTVVGGKLVKGRPVKGV